MTAVLEFLAGQPVLLLFILVGIGSAIGEIRVKGVAIAAAAVLFIAIAFSAWAKSGGIDISLEHLEILGSLGLILFTYTVGVLSGSNFFASLREGWRPILAMIGLLVVCALVAFGGGKVLGLDEATSGGTLAGALTNTPMLASVRSASGDNNAPTIGYAVAYIFGVLGMLFFAQMALRQAPKDRDAPTPLTSRTIRVETDSSPSIAALEERYEGHIKFARIRHGEHNPVLAATDEDVLRRDDLVTVVGPAGLVQDVTAELGHKSSHDLRADRRFLDFRRITVSNPSLSGRTIAELDLEERFSARIIRVRRGDVDMLAEPGLVLQTGDRVRVVASRQTMDSLSKYFGDSARGLADINPVGFAIGLALGVGLGLIQIPLGSFSFALGPAAGTLLMGLVFGRLRRVGPFVTTMPTSSSQAISELGLLMFLAQAGISAGTQIAGAFASGEWIKILVLGMVVTTVLGLGMYLVMRRVFKSGGTRLSGMLAGAQTQPAVLAFANAKTNTDSRVALGYALIYPGAMVAKILLGQIMGLLALAQIN
ncbi:MAG: transporter [Bifidobacteriaceae bacterium]|jgi:putative transport protein|nr:transporter [Bifidobacteriaceae bacterium]